MAELAPMGSTRPRTGSVRVVRSADLRQLHRLLMVVVAMEVVDLTLNLWRLRRG